MSLSRPSHLMHFLQEIGVRPQKKLSQNFLIDGNITRKMIQAAQLDPGDLVLEIGPGPGALTEALLAHGCRVIAIEKDANFANRLMRLQKEAGSLQVYQQDILTFPLEEFLQEQQNGEQVKVVANLPYHITTPIALRLLPLHRFVISLTLMLQKEVGLRFCAEAGSADYGSLSLFTKYYAEPSYCFTVPPTCFFPQPQVYSSVIRMHLKEPPLAPHQEGAFFQLTRSAFQKRRKMITSSLKERYPQEILKASLQEETISMQARPEELTLDQFLRLFHRLTHKNHNR